MYRLEKTSLRDREDTFLNDARNPSFSSTLLDKIYRSIDEGERKSGEMKLHRETTGKKQSRSSGKCCNRGVEEEEATASLRRACMLEKWMEKKVSEKIGSQGRHQPAETDKRLRHDHDQDALFFSSTSSSSDSSCGGFSSPDTESMLGVRSRASCFAPPRPKPVRTTVSDKKERRHNAQFCEQRDFHVLDDYRSSSNTASHEEGLIKSKSRALKIYNNLKKVKQPISPGGRLTNFLNSLFTPGNTKKSKTTPSVGGYEEANGERKSKSGQASVSASASASACSSASSFSRSCLSKTSPSSREKLRNGVKRSVRFYPVSVIVDEDSRPCGHKILYEQNDHSLMMPVSVPTAWKIGRSPTYKKNEGEGAGREFLKEYLQNQKKSDFILMDLPIRTNEDEEEEDDDDAASCSSSDLFELDHLAVMENGRYCEELPVYETTHVRTNRAIANGLII